METANDNSMESPKTAQPEVHVVPTAKNLDIGVTYADPGHVKVDVSTLNLNVMIVDLSI